MSMNDWKTMSIDRDNNPVYVREFQAFCNTKFSHLWGRRHFREDGIFGKNTKFMAESAQHHLLLDNDGTIGPKSIEWLKSYKRQNRIMLLPDQPEFRIIGRYWSEMGGWIPEGKGLGSTFGGPDDAGDNMYGQAYMTTYPKPASLASHNPELMDMGIFRPEIATMGEFPMVKFFNKKDSEGNQIYVRASTSWALNPESFFCAIRTKGGYGKYNEENPLVIIINPENGKIVVCLRSDYGPTSRLITTYKGYPAKRDIDISKGAAKALDYRTDQCPLLFAYGAPDGRIGYIGKMASSLI